jgi:thiamine-monophosphate kinase
MTKKGLTEREIIGVLKHRFQSGPKLPLGFDDDVAAYQMSRRNQVVLKTDMLVGNTDVPPGMTLGQAGRKAVVATVSDFAAKGVQPRGLLVSLGLVPPVRASTVKEIAFGLEKGAKEYGCRIVGGDTSETDELVIDCVGFGFAQTGGIIRRDGAKPGDIVAVTGEFGRTSAGLRIMLGQNKPWSSSFSKLIHSVVHPSAKLETGLKLAETGFVNSSIDSSDGLAWSLHEIARVSRVNIGLERIPVAPDARRFAEEEGLIAEELALFGGEEYELVLTIAKNRFVDVKEKVRSLIEIGRVEKGTGEVTALIRGRRTKIEPRGYEHFR